MPTYCACSVIVDYPLIDLFNALLAPTNKVNRHARAIYHLSIGTPNQTLSYAFSLHYV